MNNKQTPIVIAILAVGIIITLAIVLTRNNNQDTTEPAPVTETEQQPEPAPQPEPQRPPIPQPKPQPQPIPEPEQQPTPPQDGLPANWDSLTSQEKNALNPYGCDHETQWVSAEDGSCIDRPIIDEIDNPACGESPLPSCQQGLPANWDSLTSQEKNALNPFDCDHETQWVSAEDGTCIYKQIDCLEGQTPLPDGGCQNINDIECEDWQETNSNGECINKPGANDYVLLDANCHDRLAVDPPWSGVCMVSIATTGNDNLEQFLAEIVLPLAEPNMGTLDVRADVYEYNGYDNLSEYAGADFIAHRTSISNPDFNPNYWDGWDG